MSGLWSRLASLTLRGRPTPTVLCLAEAAEKNVAAITLRSIHGEHAAVMDAAMRITLSEREVTTSGNLTVQAGGTFSHPSVRSDKNRNRLCVNFS